MKPFIRVVLAGGLTLGALFACCLSRAQQKNSSSNHSISLQTYDATRELAVIGTVTAFSVSSKDTPVGARATIQTASGPIQVHLGDPRLLAASRFSLATGDSVRIIGENVTTAQSTLFLARIIQKGTESLTVRTLRGIPIVYASPKTNVASAAHARGGVL